MPDLRCTLQERLTGIKVTVTLSRTSTDLTNKGNCHLKSMIDGLRKAGVPENAFGFEGRTEDRLNSESLEKIAVNKAWSGIDGYGRPFEQQISKDGRIAYNNHVTLLVGKVWIAGDKLCVRFRSNVLGRDDCGYVYQNQDGSRELNNEYVWSAIGNTYYFSVNE